MPATSTIKSLKYYKQTWENISNKLFFIVNSLILPFTQHVPLMKM